MTCKRYEKRKSWIKPEHRTANKFTNLIPSRKRSSTKPSRCATGPNCLVNTKLREKSSSNCGGWFCKIQNYVTQNKFSKMAEETYEIVIKVERVKQRRWLQDLISAQGRLRWLQSQRQSWQNAIVCNAVPDFSIHWNFWWPNVDDRKDFVVVLAWWQERLSWWIEFRFDVKETIVIALVCQLVVFNLEQFAFWRCWMLIFRLVLLHSTSFRLFKIHCLIIDTISRFSNFFLWENLL